MSVYALKKWPDKVYPGEIDKVWAADVAIDVCLNEIKQHGPAPHGYSTKHLGKKMRYIWQLNMKIKGRQIRILYAQYDKIIVLLRIHKKSSPQEQQADYSLAISRKREVDAIMSSSGKGSDGLYSFN